METVDTVDNLAKLHELLWCKHVDVMPQRMFGHATTIHAYLRGKAAAHIVVEGGKVTLLCNSCWIDLAQVPMFRLS